jgi:hypothetical protein
VCWPLDPKVAGSKPGQGDGFLRAIKIRSTPSSRMGSKAGMSHVVRFYGMTLEVPQGRIDKIIISCRPSGSQVRS